MDKQIKNNFDGIAWENKGKLGLKTLFITCKNILLHPGISFSKMNKTGGLAKPLSFALIMVLFGNTVATFWDFKLNPELAEKVLGNIYFSYFLLPMLILASIFVGAGLIYFFMILFNAKKNYKNAFQIVAYSTSTYVLLIFPGFIVVLIFLIWSFVIQTLGVREVFQISTKKAFLSIFCSFILVRIILSPISMPRITDMVGL